MARREIKDIPTLLEVAREAGLEADVRAEFLGPAYDGEIKYVGPLARDEIAAEILNRGPDPRIAETVVHEAQPGVTYGSPTGAEAQEMTFHEPIAETVVHEAQPGVEPRSHLKDADVSTKRETVPPPRGPGVPSGGRRLRRHLKD